MKPRTLSPWRFISQDQPEEKMKQKILWFLYFAGAIISGYFPFLLLLNLDRIEINVFPFTRFVTGGNLLDWVIFQHGWLFHLSILFTMAIVGRYIVIVARGLSRMNFSNPDLLKYLIWWMTIGLSISFGVYTLHTHNLFLILYCLVGITPTVAMVLRFFQDPPTVTDD
jgi:hypothetical protein